jgi:hypothetical protein
MVKNGAGLLNYADLSLLTGKFSALSDSAGSSFLVDEIFQLKVT